MLTADFERVSSFTNKNGEIEVKFGYFDDRRFISKVTYGHYQRLKSILDGRYGGVQEMSTVYQGANDVRKIVINEGNHNDRVIWQRKSRVADIDHPEYEIRLSLRTEEPIDEVAGFTHDSMRIRTRYSYTIGENRVDITHVVSTFFNRRTNVQEARDNYEVEVEFQSEERSRENFERFSTLVTDVFKWLRGTENIYKTELRQEMIRDVNRIMGSNQVDTIDRDHIVVETRNIKMEDLVFGGIVGNKKTNYAIAHKADGLRKLLIVHRTGIWIAFPADEYNLVAVPSPRISPILNMYSGTVFDGELVKAKKGIERPKFWYLGFDCLSMKDSNGITNGIQNSPYTSRMEFVKSFAELVTKKMRVHELLFEAKKYDVINNPREFFGLVDSYIGEGPSLQFLEDGLIFTPVNAPYNPHSEMNSYRVLTKIPDVCKWKDPRNLTIDFLIRWREGNQIELYSYDEKRKMNVLFTGSNKFPLIPSMIDDLSKPKLETQAGENIIIEYNIINGKFRPRGVRTDKKSPNKLSTAINVWDDIHNPITPEDLLGQTDRLTSAYHGRIKSKLLEENVGIGETLLDIGSGRGGDISKWKKFAKERFDNAGKKVIIDPPGHIIAVEPNNDNLDEFKSRMAALGMEDYITVINKMGQDAREITKIVRGKNNRRVNVIAFMLSLSFFFRSEQDVDNLVNTIIANLKPGGRVIFLTIDGDLVESLFKTTGEKVIRFPFASMELEEDEKLLGRTLDIDLPGTIVGHQKETLVRIEYLGEKLQDYGFSIDGYSIADGEDLLTEEQTTFSSLYSYGAFIHDPKKDKRGIASLFKVVSSIPQYRDEDIALGKIEKEEKKVSKKTKKSIAVESDYLPMLPVKYKKGKEVLSTQAIGDDITKELKCSWYDDVYRIATIGDGSCFIHAVLKAFYQPYQENSSAKYRVDLASKIRRDLALAITEKNPMYPQQDPSQSYWSTSGNGALVNLMEQELVGEEIISNIDYSPYGIQRLLNSASYLGDEIYSLIANILKIDIYILRGTKDDLFPHSRALSSFSMGNSIVIMGNESHYEVVSIKKEEGYQTVFSPDDPFIRKILEISNETVEQLETETGQNPDDNFISLTITNFSDNNRKQFTIPDTLYESFDISDTENAFLKLFHNLYPRIRDDVISMGYKVSEPEILKTIYKVKSALNVLVLDGIVSDEEADDFFNSMLREMGRSEKAHLYDALMKRMAAKKKGRYEDLIVKISKA